MSTPDPSAPSPRPSPAAAALRAALVAVLPTVLACLVLLEIGLRVTGRLPSNTTDGFFEQDGDAFKLRAGMTKVSRTPSFTYTVHTNTLGLRDREAGEARLSGRYYAFLGDSMTFANGVDWDDSFVGVFARRAADEGVGVANLAVAGHHIADQQALLSRLLGKVSPGPERVVVILNPQFMRTFEERYTDVFVKSGFIFKRDAWVVPYLTVLLGNGSAAYTFLRDGARRLQAKLQPASGTEAASAFLDPFSREAPLARPEVQARLEAQLDGLDRVIRAAGAEPVYVYVPTSADPRAEELLGLTGRPREGYDFDLYLDLARAHCRRSGAGFVDLRPVVQKLHAEGKTLAFMQDMHFNAEVNRALGAALHEALSPRASGAPMRPRGGGTAP